MKGRNPKVEGRKKAEDRRSKTEGRRSYEARPSPAARTKAGISRAVSLFGFRVSAFFRPSGFGIRILPVGLWLLAAQSVLAAATNSLAPDKLPPLRPPHAEIPPTFWDRYGLWVILFGILLLALVGIAVWFLIRPKPPVIVPP